MNEEQIQEIIIEPRGKLAGFQFLAAEPAVIMDGYLDFRYDEHRIVRDRHLLFQENGAPLRRYYLRITSKRVGDPGFKGSRIPGFK